MKERVELTGELIPRGQVHIPSKFGMPPNDRMLTRDWLERASGVFERRATPEYLEENLLHPDHADTIAHRLSKKDGSRVNSLYQLEPWQHGAVLITAAPKKLPVKEGRTPVQFVYDYSHETQVGYHKQILTALQTMAHVLLPGESTPDGMPPVVVMENAVSELSGERLSGRSIALQHAIAVKTGLPVNDPVVEREHIGKEVKWSQSSLQHMDATQADNFISEVEQYIKSEVCAPGQNLDFFKRSKVLPYGYAIVMPQSGNLTDDADLLAQIMKSHFKINSELVNHAIRETTDKKFIERFFTEGYGLQGYANRHYFYNSPHPVTGEPSTHIIYSPSIFGGGAYENVGRRLLRGSGIESPFSEDEMATYRAKLKKEYNKVLGKAA